MWDRERHAETPLARGSAARHDVLLRRTAPGLRRRSLADSEPADVTLRDHLLDSSFGLGPSQEPVVRYAPDVLNGWKTAAVRAAERVPSLEFRVLAHAREHGYPFPNMDLARSASGAGVVIHKRRLGYDFLPFPGAPEFAIAIRPESRQAILTQMPIFLRRPGRFERAGRGVII